MRMKVLSLTLVQICAYWSKVLSCRHFLPLWYPKCFAVGVFSHTPQLLPCKLLLDHLFFVLPKGTWTRIGMTPPPPEPQPPVET